VNATNSFSSDISRFFTGSPTDKAVWMLIAGVVAASIGLFGTMSRIELWLPVIAMWALMLLWSKPWLDRFRYGPFEWLWRSLARWQLQPMRREAPPA